MDKLARINTTIPSPYAVTAIYIDTHDTKTFRFGLPADATLDMVAGEHVQSGIGRKAKTEGFGIVRIDINGRNSIRAWYCCIDSRKLIHGTVPRKYPRSLLHPFLDE